MTPKDVRGVDIEVGDTVAYPNRRGSRMWLTITTIHTIDTVKEFSYSYGSGVNGGYARHEVDVLRIKGKTDKGRSTHTRKLQRVVVIQKGNKNV